MDLLLLYPSPPIYILSAILIKAILSSIAQHHPPFSSSIISWNGKAIMLKQHTIPIIQRVPSILGCYAKPPFQIELLRLPSIVYMSPKRLLWHKLIKNSALSGVQGFICTPLVAQNFMSAWLIFSLTFTDYFNGETSCYPNADIRMRWTNWLSSRRNESTGNSKG